MHLASETLSTLAVLGALLVLPLSAGAISDSAAQCVRSTHDAGCGEAAALAECFSNLGDFFLQTDVEICHVYAGCGVDEAAAAAISLLARCAAHEPQPSTFVQELRKRQRRPATTTEESTDTADATTADEETTPTRAATTPARTTAARTTAEASTTAEDTDTDSVVVVTETRSGDTTALPAVTTGPLTGDQCMSTTTITVQICTPVSTAGGKSACEEKSQPKPTCRPGMLCKMDSVGSVTCLQKIDKLSTGGIIVALVFAGAIVVSIGLMTFFCCREKSQQKKLKAKMEAAAIAKASGAGAAVAAASKKRDVSARVPLMAAQGGPPETSYGGGQAYGDAPPPQGQAAVNPFQDSQRF
jgi:hypothetical protein